jgi:hypothetical protein
VPSVLGLRASVASYARPGRPCRVCANRERGPIDAGLRVGHSPRYVARLYDLSRAALSRHKRVCLGLEGGRGDT